MTDSSALNYRQIRVGQVTIGMVGLEKLFMRLYEYGHWPDEEMAAELVQGARRHNYIPPAGAAESGKALLREYRRFCEQQANGSACAAGYGAWRSRPRETVPWFPTIHAELCDDCGACLRFCSFGVYAADDDDQVQVVEPFRCQVGCSTCERICKLGAIAFPPNTILLAFDQ